MAVDPNDYGMYSFVPGGGYSAMEQRRRIAMQLLSGKKAHPKTFGEGLSSIGDAIGDIAVYKYLERLSKEEQAKRDKAMAPLVGGTGAAAGTGSVSTAAPPPQTAVSPPASVSDAEQPSAPGEPIVVSEGGYNTLDAAAGTPTAGETLISDGGYNALDAAAGTPTAGETLTAQPTAGYRPAPAYLQAALANSGLPPERQAYLGHLASKEAQSANEVSPTGAAGPFQFIRSTGRQYGLVGPEGDRRTNIAASIVAANRLTDDNAATLRAGLGRDPTPGELALAHQQGAGTAVKMLTGAGNASPYNLAVNNAGGLGGTAAAQKIMAYYGMPNGPVQAPQQTASVSPSAAAQDETLGLLSGRSGGGESLSYAPTAALRPAGDVTSDAPPTSGIQQAIGDTVQQRRDAITKELQTQQAPAPEVPPPNPTIPTSAPTSTAGSPNVPTVVSDIAPMPTAGAQVAQAPPRGAYVPPEPARPAMRSPYELLPKDEREAYAERLQYSDDPEIRRGAQVYLSQRKLVRDQLSARETERYKTDDAIFRERTKQRDELIASQQQRTLELLHKSGAINEQQYTTGLKQLELKKATQADVSETRYYGAEGKPPGEVMKALDESRDKAKSATGSIEAFSNAKEVLDAGTAVGTGAQAKLLYYKARALAGDQNAARIVANTESFQSSLGPAVMDAIKKYGGSQISNTDREYAAAMTGADISLSEAAARRIIAIGERAARATLDDHKRMVERDVGDRPRLKEFYNVSEPLPPVPGERAPAAQQPVVNAPSEAEAMKLPPGTRFRLPDGRTGTVR